MALPLKEPKIRRLTCEACGRSVKIFNCSSFACGIPRHNVSVFMTPVAI